MANSVTARFNDDCKVFVSMSDDTTVEKAVIIDAEGNETDIGGGGGSSDFSTAEVTININAASYNPIAIVNNAIRQIIITETGTYTIPLYKGVAILPFPPSNLTEQPVFTGDIELSIEDLGVKVTGNGTITLVGSVS